ncbi:O-antigen/teichoic acid export membrane protein [Idiomarina loihiensis]|uniref:oligosaccharide flippase family protein n=1 Tax=Idiomarina TaxID=135575 RepID=UPI000D70E29C|nr:MULTISPECIES: oligosaccharide flippase family protein [Idiomarina]PWW37687.1 O-antigen/teichoic acid export membrane protein [Idiomarina loihiensis]TDP47406.1 O-antigen/teichoic acid export membrane protein [Idiomarina loihiensis]TDS23147.1 O-antigen/teichoic acid export membrane protein [Idiomarina sp. H2]
MSFKKNIIANYTSQIYAAGIGILILPLYIRYIGAEAYGLVGFFAMLQSWFSLLDLGLTPTIARETARYRGGSMSALKYRQLFRALSGLFLAVAFIGGCGLWFLAESIANKWLKVDELDIVTVVVAVKIMAISVALRWLGGLFRGVITGSEKILWLSIFNAAIATLRFPAVFITMWLYGFTVSVFFWHQLALIIFEVVSLHIMSNRLKPDVLNSASIGWSFQPIKPLLKFSLTIAFTSSVWVLVTQTDKLILSGILPLKDYGFFTLAVLMASGIMILSAPISTVIMPRMARLKAERNHDETIAIYRNATQIVSVIAGSAAVTMAFCAKPLLYVWTGDYEVTNNAAPILTLYALGNGVLAISAFPYYLQYAVGNLRYHLIGNLAIVIVLIPVIIFSAIYYGGVGAGWAWLGINSLYFIVWVGYVHRKLEPGLHRVWFIEDVFVITLSSVLSLLFIHNFILNEKNPLLFIIVSGLTSLTASTIASRFFREKIRKRLNFKCINLI